jgi:hypothetical protein
MAAPTHPHPPPAPPCQYPHEKEIAFPPLCGIEVNEINVEASCLLVNVRMDVNAAQVQQAKTNSNSTSHPPHPRTSCSGHRRPSATPILVLPPIYSVPQTIEHAVSKMQRSVLQLLDIMADELRLQVSERGYRGGGCCKAATEGMLARGGR